MRCIRQAKVAWAKKSGWVFYILLSTSFGTWVRVIPCHPATGFFSTVGGWVGWVCLLCLLCLVFVNRVMPSRCPTMVWCPPLEVKRLQREEGCATPKSCESSRVLMNWLQQYMYIYIYIQYIHTHNFIYIYDMSFWVHLHLLHALLASVRSMDVEGLWQKRCCQRHAPCGLLRSNTQVFIVFFLSDLELLLGTYDFSHRRLPAKAAWCDPWRKTLIIKDSAFGHEKMIQVCLAPSHQV